MHRLTVAAAGSAYGLFDLLAAVFADEYFADELGFGHVSNLMACGVVTGVAPCSFLNHAKHGAYVCVGWRLVGG